MKLIIYLLLALWLPISIITSAEAENKLTNNALIEKLLSYRVPSPGWEEALSKKRNLLKSPSLPNNCKTSSKLDVFMACWGAEHLDFSADKHTLRRITQNYENYVQYLNHYLNHDLIINNEINAKNIKNIYEKCQIESCEIGKHKKYWLERVKKWLMTHTIYFRREFIQKASKLELKESKRISAKGKFAMMFSKEVFTYIENEEYLEALAQLDWNAAKPIIDSTLESDKHYVKLFGLIQLFKNHYRQNNEYPSEILTQIENWALDESLQSDVRQYAITTLLSLEWPGKSNFYRKLLTTNTYIFARDNILQNFAKKNQKNWVPYLLSLINDPNKNIHNNAVTALSGFQYSEARKDITKSLLPWLSNPKWSESDPRNREILINNLQFISLPESVSGLTWAFQNEKEEDIIADTAKALAFQKADSVVSLLKEKMQLVNWSVVYFKPLVKAIIDLEGFTNPEIIDYIKNYKNQVSTLQAKKEFRQKTSFLGKPGKFKNSLIGFLLMKEHKNKEFLTHLIIENIELSDILLETLVELKDPSFNALLINRIKKGNLNPRLLHSLLKIRSTLTEYHKGGLTEVYNRHGIIEGIATIALKDSKNYRKILTGTDTDSQKALIAAARLTREALDLDDVSKLLHSKDAQLSKAAEKYLLYEDSPSARILLQKFNQDDIRILGGRMRSDPGHFTYREFDDLEQTLIEKIKNNSEIEEIFALLSAGYWGGYGQIFIIKTGDKIEMIRLQGWGRYSKRILSKEEFKKLEFYISNNSIDDLPPLRNSIHDGIQYEYVHIRNGYGRRVFMNNPKNDDILYKNLVNHFWGLLENKNVTIGWTAVDNNKGARSIHRSKKPKKWIQYQNNYRPVSPTCNELINPTEEQYKSTWKSRHKKVNIFSDQEYLYYCKPDNTLEVISKGNYGKPIVTPNNKWMVVAKTDTNWASPNYVVIVNLETMEESKVKLKPADNFNPVSYIEPRGKVLLEQYRDSKTYTDRTPIGPEKPTYYLLNPATGTTEEVKGDFYPFNQHSASPLQPAKKNEHVWFAQAYPRKNHTIISLFDISNFKLNNVITIKSHIFNSKHMWVDEEMGLIYVDTSEFFSNSRNDNSVDTMEEILVFPLPPKTQ